MSDSCPVLTDKDIELIDKFRDEISEIQSSLPVLLDSLNECKDDKSDGESELTGGGTKEEFINISVKIIVFVITALAAGASTAFFLTAIPEPWQLQIISWANFEPTPLSVCKTTAEYTLGAMYGVANRRLSCSHRAEMLEQGITRIQMGVSAITGFTSAALESRVREFLTRRTTPAISQTRSTPYSIVPSEKTNVNGGTRKSRKSRNKRKSRNGKRKSRRSKKY